MKYTKLSTGVVTYMEGKEIKTLSSREYKNKYLFTKEPFDVGEFLNSVIGFGIGCLVAMGILIWVLN